MVKSFGATNAKNQLVNTVPNERLNLFFVQQKAAAIHCIDEPRRSLLLLVKLLVGRRDHLLVSAGNFSGTNLKVNYPKFQQ